MAEHAALPKIAFLGTGLMGKPMAARLLKAAYPLTVWNRSPEKAFALTRLGARIAASPLDAVYDGGDPADIVISMLADGGAVAETLRLALPGLLDGSVWVDMSSTQQAEARQFAAILRDKAVNFIDAPVSGGVTGAEAGTLAIMAGAAPQAYARVEQMLQVLGRPTRVGDPGSGQLAKLCNQLIVGGTINIVAEALLLAQAGGADPAAVRQALRGGFAESRILEVHGQRMLERQFIPGGQVKSQAKDMENILAAAAEAGLQLPLAQLVTEVYRHLRQTHPAADHAAALLQLESQNPGRRVGTQADTLPE
ncbi:MAG: NAD(P)-dependent oxidoreductase [Burkholderiales bacterium]|nr:NAD(P)-dependent oxidoreductase [Burkholderiales bacterium]